MLRKATRYKPEERYETGAELARALYAVRGELKKPPPGTPRLSDTGVDRRLRSSTSRPFPGRRPKSWFAPGRFRLSHCPRRTRARRWPRPSRTHLFLTMSTRAPSRNESVDSRSRSIRRAEEGLRKRENSPCRMAYSRWSRAPEATFPLPRDRRVRCPTVVRLGLPLHAHDGGQRADCDARRPRDLVRDDRGNGTGHHDYQRPGRARKRAVGVPPRPRTAEGRTGPDAVGRRLSGAVHRAVRTAGHREFDRRGRAAADRDETDHAAGAPRGERGSGQEPWAFTAGYVAAIFGLLPDGASNQSRPAASGQGHQGQHPERRGRSSCRAPTPLFDQG